MEKEKDRFSRVAEEHRSLVEDVCLLLYNKTFELEPSIDSPREALFVHKAAR